MIGAARVTNRLPTLPCNSCYRHVAFRNIHCLPTTRGKLKLPEGVEQKGVGWGERNGPSHSNVVAMQGATAKVLTLSGYLQSYNNFIHDWRSVCWALQPTEELQRAAQEYYDGILTSHNVTVTEHTRVVNVHLRRGDYVGKAGFHGLLSLEYYESALEGIRSRLQQLEPQSAAEGMVVVVLTEQENVEWCKANMNWGERHGVRQTVRGRRPRPPCPRRADRRPLLQICADAKGKRCKGEMTDMYALALGDFLVIANSSFSWWAHFFGKCMADLQGWWSVGSSIAHRTAASFRTTVFPHRWYTKRLTQDRSKTWDFVPSDGAPSPPPSPAPRAAHPRRRSPRAQPRQGVPAGAQQRQGQMRRESRRSPSPPARSGRHGVVVHHEHHRRKGHKQHLPAGVQLPRTE